MNFKGCFGDKRLEKRAVKIVQSLFVKSCHSIRQMSDDYASQRGWYRFLNNNKTKEEELIEQITKQCGVASKGKVVLSIQDTSDISLYNHKNRINLEDSIGRTNAANYDLGFLIHPSFVVDATNGFPLGYSAIKVWHRFKEKTSKRERERECPKLAIEEKESYKWIESSMKTKDTLSKADSIIIVQDREGDIYEQFVRIPDEKTHLLIRSRMNRRLEEEIKLHDKLAKCKVAGNYSIDIPAERRRKRNKRTAKLEIRYCPITIKRPQSAFKHLKESVDLYVVEAKEVNTKSKQPVIWRILTTLPVNSLKEALNIIEWYSWRWMVEEVFRILKKEGYNIEASELESAKSIRKLCVLMLTTITRLFQMRFSYSIPEGETLESLMCFNEKEQECLEQQCVLLEGKTEKLKNPFPEKSLSWATWVIARLGGWKGYNSQTTIGITTLLIGLRRFYDIYQGWILYEDVYTR
ncbi:MAG: IS4 family transposase [Vicingus serpentipes]|nr:IS4 family transposase [Vicingus serpentipes]